MEIYVVQIEEVLQRQMEIVADSAEQAWEIVDRMYAQCKIVLNESDLLSQQIDVIQ